MTVRSFQPLLPLMVAVSALAGCATTARMHSADELAGVGRQCGVPLGEIAQFEEEPRLLFLFPVERAGKLACVRRWARRRGMRVVYLEGVERVDDAPAQ